MIGTKRGIAVGLALLMAPVAAHAQGATATSYVASEPAADRFALAAGGRVAPIIASAGEDPGVVRAAKDLVTDLWRVTSVEPAFTMADRPASAVRRAVLVGTLGKSPLIDGLVRAGRLDVTGIAGKWETFVVQVVRDPMPGLDQALVIAGSDRRGTIFGIYDVSGEIGVSPWYWWADVPVPHRTDLHVLPGRHTDGTPAVKYRGIFINDEAPAFSGWTREKFGGVNHQAYEHVFELILRLKGNYLWPAMWGNAFNDDDSLNAPLAHEYGIVMGTSHHEPMQRAQQEWKRYGKGEWNYETNDSTLRAFWEQGIRNMGDHESIVTLAMRGDGDMPMSRDANISLLERIVADQRRIIADVTKKPLAATPQVWALYKEVQEYYDQGMRVPDDVTLLFADDNWGNVRRLPERGAPPRAGGYGIYYHFDYVGGPRNYKWINTNPLPRIWEQLHLTYQYGVDRIWVVNVGDLKPMELPISFFLDYAWNPDAWPVERLPEYTRLWAARQFGPEHAGEIAALLDGYAKFNGRRKPELLSATTYSLSHYGEADSVVAQYDRLAAEAERIDGVLPPEFRDAFFQLVLHPVKASANINDLWVTVAKNRLYAQQGRAATNALAARARTLFVNDAELSRQYNEDLAGGKWSHMMDQTHISYTYWQQPPRDTMPLVHEIALPAAPAMGVAIDGSDAWWGPGGASTNDGDAAADSAVLPTFDAYNRQRFTIDVFNRGSTPFDYTVTAGAPWLTVTPARGRVELEQRLAVTVDWTRAPAGTTRAPITISGPGGSVVVHAVAFNPPSPKPADVTGFVEANGYVSIEAEHYTRAVDSNGVKWTRVPDLGRTLGAMTAFPVTAPALTPGGRSARLEYAMHLFNAGDVTVRVHLAPTLDFSGAQKLRYAISFDDETPQVIAIHPDESTRAWEAIVANAINVRASKHTIASPGAHVLKLWLVDPGLVVEKVVVETGVVAPSYLGPPESYHRGTAGAER